METIDEKDREILAAMQRDGRATYGEIGQTVGLAASSVHDRVRKMEQRGVITGYGPRIAPEKLGLGLLAFVSLYTNVPCTQMATRLETWPEVEEFHSVAGQECAILKVRTRDASALHDLLERLRDLAQVESTRSTIVLRTMWDHRDLEPSAESARVRAAV